MPVWIQVVNYQVGSLLYRFDRDRSSKAGYVAMNGLRLVTVGMMLMETVRTAVLRHWLPINVRFADGSRCRVVSGRWISPFTGKVIQNSSEIDIDHVVPLKWAWKRGAKGWTQAKRERFANDMVNLSPVELSLNRSKGAQGPDEWLPPSGQCGYVARFVRIVKQYDLKPTKPETRWLKAFLERCRI